MLREVLYIGSETNAIELQRTLPSGTCRVTWAASDKEALGAGISPEKNEVPGIFIIEESADTEGDSPIAFLQYLRERCTYPVVLIFLYAQRDPTDELADWKIECLPLGASQQLAALLQQELNNA